MNFNLNCKGFEKYLINKILYVSSVHYIFKFENGYEVSVVKGLCTYGGSQDLWELMVLNFYPDAPYDLDYITTITDDVIGYLTDEDVLELLRRIKALKKPIHNES